LIPGTSPGLVLLEEAARADESHHSCCEKINRDSKTHRRLEFVGGRLILPGKTSELSIDFFGVKSNVMDDLWRECIVLFFVGYSWLSILQRAEKMKSNPLKRRRGPFLCPHFSLSRAVEGA
jgi:hypothetical protein